MAILKFHARGDLLVREPGSVHVKGAPASYVGRKWSQDVHGFPAVADPFCVPAGSEDAQRLALLTSRDACLWPADEATAAACGVSYTPIKLVDGEWVAAPKTTQPTKVKD